MSNKTFIKTNSGKLINLNLIVSMTEKKRVEEYNDSENCFEDFVKIRFEVVSGKIFEEEIGLTQWQLIESEMIYGE